MNITGKEILDIKLKSSTLTLKEVAEHQNVLSLPLSLSTCQDANL